jgi:SAM-dependent methyltransferase
MKLNSFIRLWLILLLCFNVHVSGQYYDEDDQYEVPFVPTLDKIVDEMLKIANVNDKDYIFDLGCGDGRIVITAAKKYGARGVGIDINPVRIEESKANAIREGVSDKVTFIQQDLFEADIREATVVALYLLQSVNLRLRPKLLQELQPGTRIVSHNYDMGEWEPDKSLEIFHQYGHKVYFWTVPADISGTWHWNSPVSSQNQHFVLQVKQKFQEASGVLTVGDTAIPLKDLKIEGNKVQFTTEESTAGRTANCKYEGLVQKSSISGKIISKSGGGVVEKVWEAKRNTPPSVKE